MSEEAKEPKAAPKKKKKLGKLPIIVAIVLLLAGGGFYALKGRGGPKGPVKIQLAAKDTDLDEFLTNTASPAVYVRTKISIRLCKDYTDAKFKDNLADVRDAVIAVLNATSPDEITNAKYRGKLKQALALAMNTALDNADGGVKKTGPKPTTGSPGKPAPVDPDWDSATGPVMTVRFTSLATQ